MKYLSVCSGIEAASVAWHPLGWQAVGFSEIEPFPSAVLAHHWPDVPNLGDMTKHHEWPNTLRPDIIVGGTPCQAFSVAGLRKGLEDPRGNLTLVFLGILAQFRPRWVVWENVPGVLSDRTGAFGAFLGGLGELGYGFAYRVLDAQYFGVAQRRRRVFVVGCLGGWKAAASVLFEPACMRGDSPPSRKPGKIVAPTLDVRAGRSGETTFHTSGGLVPEVAGCLQERDAKGADSDTKPGHLIPVALRGHSDYGDGLPSLRAKGGDCAGGSEALVAMSFNMHKSGSDASSMGVTEDRTDCLRAFDKSPLAVMAPRSAVRRLTPRECERLQGFPDDHTLIPWRGKMSPDGPRYKALGNSMAVPVMRWIGRRIAQITPTAAPLTGTENP